MEKDKDKTLAQNNTGAHRPAPGRLWEWVNAGSWGIGFNGVRPYCTIVCVSVDSEGQRLHRLRDPKRRK